MYLHLNCWKPDEMERHKERVALSLGTQTREIPSSADFWRELGKRDGLTSNLGWESLVETRRDDLMRARLCLEISSPNQTLMKNWTEDFGLFSAPKSTSLRSAR